MTDIKSKPHGNIGKTRTPEYRAHQSAVMKSKYAAEWAQNELDQAKTCTKCLVRQPFSEFHVTPGGLNNLRSRCATCQVAKAMVWNRANKEKHVASEHKYKKTKPVDAHNRDLRKNLKRYGITIEDRQRQFEFQNGLCPICSTQLDLATRYAQVDHCHKSGRARGILCAHCNSALAYLRDNPESAIAAAKYLQSGGIFQFLNSHRPEVSL